MHGDTNSEAGFVLNVGGDSRRISREVELNWSGGRYPVVSMVIGRSVIGGGGVALETVRDGEFGEVEFDWKLQMNRWAKGNLAADLAEAVVEQLSMGRSSWRG